LCSHRSEIHQSHSHLYINVTHTWCCLCSCLCKLVVSRLPVTSIDWQAGWSLFVRWMDGWSVGVAVGVSIVALAAFTFTGGVFHLRLALRALSGTDDWSIRSLSTHVCALCVTRACVRQPGTHASAHEDGCTRVGCSKFKCPSAHPFVRNFAYSFTKTQSVQNLKSVKPIDTSFQKVQKYEKLMIHYY
jgi:hypothetical protein